MKSITVKFNKFISERLDVLEKHILTGKNTLLFAETGGGKTKGVLKLAMELSEKLGKCVTIALPTKANVANIKQDYENEFDIACGSGYDFFLANRTAKVRITTYNTASRYGESTDIVIIDEAHLIGGSGEYRKVELEALLDSKCQIVLLSGTPEGIDSIPNFLPLNFVKNNPSKKNVTIKLSEAHPLDTMRELILNRDKTKLLIIRHNNKKTIDKIKDSFGSDEVKIVKNYSDNEDVLLFGQDKEAVDNIKKGIIKEDIDVILTTSLIDAGLSLEVHKNVDAYAVESDMPNFVDMRQYLDRVRENTGFKMHLTIIGSKFGNIIDTSVKISEDYSSGQIIDSLASSYKWYSELTEARCIEFFKKYNTIVTVIKDNSVRVFNKGSVNLSDARDITIAKNLFQFPSYGRIEALAQKNGRERDLSYFDNGEQLRFKESTAVIRIEKYIIFALNNKIPIDWFMNEKAFYDKRISNLQQVSGYMKSSIRFRELACDLIDAVLYSKENTKVSLKEYHKFDKTMKKCFDAFNFVINNNERTREKTLRVINTKVTEELENYLYHTHPSLQVKISA